MIINRCAVSNDRYWYGLTFNRISKPFKIVKHVCLETLWIKTCYLEIIKCGTYLPKFIMIIIIVAHFVEAQTLLRLLHLSSLSSG